MGHLSVSSPQIPELDTMINNTSLILVIIKVMAINIINMTIRLEHIIDKSDKSLEAFSSFTTSNVAHVTTKNKHSSTIVPIYSSAQ